LYPAATIAFGPAAKATVHHQEVANVLGISTDLLRWRIKAGKYPDAQRGNAGRRLFTIDDVVGLESVHRGSVRQQRRYAYKVAMKFFHMFKQSVAKSKCRPRHLADRDKFNKNPQKYKPKCRQTDSY
jgi:hypothetical protein